MKYCLQCGKELTGRRRKYCSFECSYEYIFHPFQKEKIKEMRKICEEFTPLLHKERRTKFDSNCNRIAIYCALKKGISFYRIGKIFNRNHGSIIQASRHIKEYHKKLGDFILDGKITANEMNKLMLFPDVIDKVVNNKLTIEQAKLLKSNIM